tara:strand:- start:3507 stop:3953 length:447 start_codon:yes stop_codon:yes gene_type:complete
MNYSLINEVWNTNNIKKKKVKKFSESFAVNKVKNDDNKNNNDSNNNIDNNNDSNNNISINHENKCNKLKNCDDYIKHIFNCKKCLKKISLKLKSEISESNINDSNINKYNMNEYLNELFEINKDLITIILFSTSIVLLIQSIEKNRKK